MPAKHQPDFIYLRHVPLRKVHLFTIIQLSCLVLLWVIKTSRAAIVFPMMVTWLCVCGCAISACLVSSSRCFSRSWRWYLFVSCWISSSPRENWAGWMIWCRSGRRRSWRMQQKRCSRGAQRQMLDALQFAAGFLCFVSSCRRNTVLLQRRKELFKSH